MRSRVVALTCVTTPLLAVAGCGGASAAKKTQTEPNAAPAASSQPPAVYKPTDDFCSVADLTALTNTYPTSQAERNQTNKAGTMTDMKCSMILSASETKQGFINIEANVYDDPETAEVTYEGLRGAAAHTGQSLTDVPGVGQHAYAYVDPDPDLGPFLVVVDGNLHLTINWARAAMGGGPADVPPDITARLTAVAKGTMAHLKT